MKGQIQSTHVSEHHERVDLEVPDVIWYKDAGLQKLYAMMPIFFLGSTLTGYDGSLLNGLQTMAPWQECKDPQKKIVSLFSNLLFADFGHPTGSRLGLFSAIQNIGGFCAVFFGMLPDTRGHDSTCSHENSELCC
jgi:hypothetical protein